MEKNVLTQNELKKITQKIWLSTKDIQIIACCGRNKAFKIKKEIQQELEKEGYFLPKGLLPTDAVLNYLKIKF